MGDLPTARLDGALRRAIDLLVAGSALIVSSPVMAAAGVLIKLQDGGPILYRRRVLGCGAIEFNAYKLRTMRVDADRWLMSQPDLLNTYQTRTKLADDPRVTRLGRFLRRFHIDELPQLVNVLTGQMSLVGPRMIHPSELARYGDFGPTRLSVRPGMTGLWQVSRLTYTYEERERLDRLYIANRRLAMDVRILLFTIPMILGRRAEFSLPESTQLGG